MATVKKKKFVDFSSEGVNNLPTLPLKCRVVVLDPKFAENTWKILELTVHNICNGNLNGFHFEEVYRFVCSYSQSPSRFFVSR